MAEMDTVGAAAVTAPALVVAMVPAAALVAQGAAAWARPAEAARAGRVAADSSVAPLVAVDLRAKFMAAADRRGAAELSVFRVVLAVLKARPEVLAPVPASRLGRVVRQHISAGRRLASRAGAVRSSGGIGTSASLRRCLAITSSVTTRAGGIRLGGGTFVIRGIESTRAPSERGLLLDLLVKLKVAFATLGSAARIGAPACSLPYPLRLVFY